jgi:hypothetical protein
LPQNRKPTENKSMPATQFDHMRTEAEKRAIQSLTQRLRLDGWEVVIPRGKLDDIHLVAEKGDRRLVGNVKTSRDSRRVTLESLLANALLRARAGVAQQGAGTPFAVLAAPTLSKSMLSALKSYADRYGRDAVVGLATFEGDLHLHGAGIDQVLGASEVRKPRLTAPQPLNLFSDLNRWLLKTLLASALPEELLTAPRGRSTTTSELASMAGVSAIVARRLLAALRRDGFLDERRRDLRLVRIEDLLQLWRADNQRPVQELRLRWLLPRGRQQLHDAVGRLVRAGRRACVGLFSACDALGFRHVQGVPATIYVESFTDDLVDILEAAPVAASEGTDLVLRIARWPESVFRAAVRTHGVLASDVLQCWLDVVDHPVRGDEQAQLIWTRAIKPMIDRA